MFFGRTNPRKVARPQNLWMDSLRHGCRVRWRGAKSLGTRGWNDDAVGLAASAAHAANSRPKRELLPVRQERRNPAGNAVLGI